MRSQKPVISNQRKPRFTLPASRSTIHPPRLTPPASRFTLITIICLLATACATAAAYTGSQPSAVAPLPTNTPTITPSPTLTPTVPSPTPTDTPTSTQTSTSTQTLTPSATGPSLTPSHTATGTKTPTNTATATRTPTFTFTPSNTPTPTYTPTRTPSSTPDPRITPRATYTPYGPAVFPTGDASKLKKPPYDTRFKPHLLFVRPIANTAPSSQYRFGMTFDGQLAPHHGADMAPGLGIEIGAAGPGTVFWAGDDLTQTFGTKTDFYGNLVVIQMNETWEGHAIYTLYGHLQAVTVAVGQQVNTGDLIGYTGSAGVAYGPHLHFEVRLDDPYSYFGAVRNPELWYKPIDGAGVIAGRVINASGRFIPGARLFINCKDSLRFVDTYWDQGTPPDNWMMENFAMSDIPNSVCNIETTINGKTYRTSAYVPPGEIAFVVIQTDDK